MKGIVTYLLGFILLTFQAYGQSTTGAYSPVMIDTNRAMASINAAADLEYSNPDSCIDIIEPVLELCRQAGFDNGTCSGLVHIGLANITKGNVDLGLLCYSQALPYVERCKYNKPLVALLYTAIASPYLKKNDYTIASSYYYKALHEVMNNGLLSSAIACRLFIGLSNLWWYLRRYDYAMRYIYQSERNARNRDDTIALVAIYGNLSNLCYSQHQLKKSDFYAQQALALAEKKHIITAQQLILANMGTTLRQQGDPAAAIPYFKKAISLADDAHSYEHNLQSYFNLSFAYYQLGNYKKAKEYVLFAIRKSEELDMDKERLGEAMQVMAGIYESEKNYKEANVWLNRYMDHEENILQKEADSSINKLEDNYAVSERDRQIVQKQLQLSKKDLEIKNKNILISGIAGSLLLLSMFFFIALRNGRHKHRIQSMQILNLEQEKELVYLKAIIDGEEKERVRLARELHDGIGGMLAAAKMTLNTIRETNSTTVSIPELSDAKRLLDDIAVEVRRTAHNLTPDILIKNSLTDALLLYCSHINTAGKLQIDVQFHGRMEEMSKSVELIFYRITQELIQNIVKHAQATQAMIQIIQDKGRLNLIVEDNGVGFDQAEIDNGFGMQNLRFRVQSLQGYISVSSTIGKGTSVYIEFDLEKLKDV